MATDEKSADKKFADALLSDDELDNVAGGCSGEEMPPKNFLNQLSKSPLLNCSCGDERNDVNPACMSAAFINGEITGGEDF